MANYEDEVAIEQEQPQEVKVDPPKKPKAVKPKVVTHKVEDLVAAASVFGTSPEVVKAALKGQTEATKEETHKRVKTFLSKGVK